MLSRNHEEVMVSYHTGSCFVAFCWYVAIKGQNCFFPRREESLAIQECAEIIPRVWSYGSSHSLSLSLAEAKEKKMAEARNKREPGKTPSFAVS